MQPRDRGPYSPIIDRPPLPPLPGGNRIIFWTIVNVEVWDITRPMPRLLLMPPQGQHPGRLVKSYTKLWEPAPAPNRGPRR